MSPCLEASPPTGPTLGPFCGGQTRTLFSCYNANFSIKHKGNSEHITP